MNHRGESPQMAHASEGTEVGQPPESPPPCSLRDVGKQSPCSRLGREGSRWIGRRPHTARAVPRWFTLCQDSKPNSRGNAMHNEGSTFPSLARTKVVLHSRRLANNGTQSHCHPGTKVHHVGLTEWQQLLCSVKAVHSSPSSVSSSVKA